MISHFKLCFTEVFFYMNDVKSGEKKRLYLYDNLKFLLIVLVVLGHLIDDSTVKLFGDGGW